MTEDEAPFMKGRFTPTFGAKPERLPWTPVAYVRDDGDALAVVTGGRENGREYPIPKRALDDGGAALWALADERLTGTDHLVRSPHNRNLISNTRTAWTT